MKKFFALLLVAAMSFSLIACGSKNETGKNDSKEETYDDSTPAGTLANAFVASLASGKTGALEIAEELSTNSIIPFMPFTMEVEEGYLAGFTEDITGFTEAATFAPMISTIPFVSYVFVTENSDAANTLKTLLEEKADLNWNICTQAEEKLCVVRDKYVFFVMSRSSFDGE